MAQTDITILRAEADAAMRRLISARNRRDSFAFGSQGADSAATDVALAHAEYRYALSLYRRAKANAANHCTRDAR